jgi:hypothetical protein
MNISLSILDFNSFQNFDIINLMLIELNKQDVIIFRVFKCHVLKS